MKLPESQEMVCIPIFTSSYICKHNTGGILILFWRTIKYFNYSTAAIIINSNNTIADFEHIKGIVINNLYEGPI